LKRRLGISTLFIPVLVTSLSACAVAQLIATKDLTHISGQPTTPVKAPYATPVISAAGENDCFIDHRDGAIVRDVPEKLSFEIVSAEPRLVHNGAEITVTVRLKNEGDQQVVVPWEVGAIEPVKTDPNDETLSYESATIRLALGSPKDGGKQAYLKRGGNSLCSSQ